MKIYFAAAISAGRQYAPIYREIVSELKHNGHTVLTEHVAHPEVVNIEKEIADQEIYQRDIQLLLESDLVLAEVSHPSTGVGYEIAYALLNHKPVICTHLKGLKMSKMITGNIEPLISIHSYESTIELLENLPGWINRL